MQATATHAAAAESGRSCTLDVLKGPRAVNGTRDLPLSQSTLFPPQGWGEVPPEQAGAVAVTPCGLSDGLPPAGTPCHIFLKPLKKKEFGSAYISNICSL